MWKNTHTHALSVTAHAHTHNIESTYTQNSQQYMTSMYVWMDCNTSQRCDDSFHIFNYSSMDTTSLKK